jgi:hypothetical protein
MNKIEIKCIYGWVMIFWWQCVINETVIIYDHCAIYFGDGESLPYFPTLSLYMFPLMSYPLFDFAVPLFVFIFHVYLSFLFFLLF